LNAFNFRLNAVPGSQGESGIVLPRRGRPKHASGTGCDRKVSGMPRDVNTVDELDAAEPGAPALRSPEPHRGRRRGAKGEQTRRAIIEAALRPAR
jgi:hypothetical protein